MGERQTLVKLMRRTAEGDRFEIHDAVPIGDVGEWLQSALDEYGLEYGEKIEILREEAA